ncbi:MAG: phytase, partial [Lacisediminimonas sp.]|nr:phytase [Lacisediminimonas sp.]
MMLGVGTPVAAAGETPAVGTGRRDAADDPEIWADPANRARGMILGTDKQAGLYVYDLTGRQIQFLAEGRLNNVDLRSDFPAEGRGQILIGASNRSAGGISFFLADPAAPGAPVVRVRMNGGGRGSAIVPVASDGTIALGTSAGGTDLT